MGTSSWIALLQDWEMLEVGNGETIHPASMPLHPGYGPSLPVKPGHRVYDEIGHRYLMRYLLPSQVGTFIAGSSAQHFVTPTPYSPEETIPYLALPAPTQPRTHVLVLDPRQIDQIAGPQWIRGAPGIQYVLVSGFPQSAIVVPGNPGAAWEIVVR